eukprot:2106799-Pyramimonas_sp.AAC.2
MMLAAFGGERANAANDVARVVLGELVVQSDRRRVQSRLNLHARFVRQVLPLPRPRCHRCRSSALGPLLGPGPAHSVGRGPTTPGSRPALYEIRFSRQSFLGGIENI